MVSFVSRVKELIDYFNSLPEVKRVHELEHFIDNNKEINSKLNDIKIIKKQMVNAKEFNQTNMYNEYKKQYDSLYSELLELPFVEEYLELLEIVNNMLLELTNSIEYKLNNIINI